MIRRMAIILLLMTTACTTSQINLGPPVKTKAASSPDGARVVRANPGNFVKKWNEQRGAQANMRWELAPGVYNLRPQAYSDPSCGNCENPNTPVKGTAGLIVKGRNVTIAGTGARPNNVVFQTRSGYGILFEDCTDCTLENVTVTGGARDRDENATNGAVVARGGKVTIENCALTDNIGDPGAISQTMVGICGIVGREGSDLVIRGNQIVRNSWDGIALYRGARATIEGNVIDGVDMARGRQAGGGRGVGIGVNWDAEATIVRNRVTRYWKGIGLFVDAKATVRENVVEDILTWGIAYWDAGKGNPVVDIRENVIYNTGACGITLTAAEEQAGVRAGSCRGNLIAKTGQNPDFDASDSYCYQMPIAVESIPHDFDLGGNYFYDNRRPKHTLLNDDLDLMRFKNTAKPLMSTLSSVPSLRGSEFLSTIGR